MVTKIAIAVANNVNPNVNSLSFELPVLPPGNNYFIAFVAVDNVNQVYANSSSFPISDNPTSSTVPLSTLKTTTSPSKSTKTHTRLVFSPVFYDFSFISFCASYSAPLKPDSLGLPCASLLSLSYS
jgi:hypothetical protein